MVRIYGIVQGVGFRPTVYRLANELGLRGDVRNDGAGVLVHIAGRAEVMEQFVRRLKVEAPPLARIERIERRPCHPDRIPQADFAIAASVGSTVRTDMAPDAATCPQCRAEIFDSCSRWYRYPFINCTHCGPRLSIIRALPYDRATTSMATFPMCPACQQDYEDVGDRRFHAQPIACPTCGPRVWLERIQTHSSYNSSERTSPSADSDALEAVCTLLNQGEIFVIKGLGGFHLACDATSETAVQTLRDRKHRYAKPFALMGRDLAAIAHYCHISPHERDLLASSAAPIVLLDRKREAQPAIAPAVAPDLPTLGFMLPYTPLHHLLLQCLERPIVLTSGNRSDEPMCVENSKAGDRLGNIATYFLLHNRDIVNRVDDSVVRVVGGRTQILRRARGYAPAPIPLPAGFETAPAILAMGGELKSSFGLLREGQAILSQHLGDLENAAVFDAYRQTLELYQKLFEHQPEAIALDLHPEYLSAKLGYDLAAIHQLPVQTIQHHHAHVAACMAENRVPLDAPPVLGIALDGLGYGEDGTLWGGEFLWADYRYCQRLGSFQPIALLGGIQAIRQPWRNTYAHLAAVSDWQDLRATYNHLELFRFFDLQPLSLLEQMRMNGVNSPLTSSAGRWFDAVAAAAGLCREVAYYEGQAAIALEAAIDKRSLQQELASAYAFNIRTAEHSETFRLLHPGPMWHALLEDLRRQESPAVVAARFHLGLAEAIAQMTLQLQKYQPFTRVALTGGVFQNAILTQQVSQRLRAADLEVLTHSLVPANDGGLALGQLAVAAARSISTA
jgi:hydrogenase maturation protein HypF